MRRWALEEQLLDPLHAAADDGFFATLEERLLAERDHLSTLEEELQRQRARVSALELERETAAGERDNVAARTVSPTDAAQARSLLVVRSTSPGPDRDYWLAHCEGFLVASPTGRGVGVVNGVRFGLRIDRPDLLEVVVGRLRHRVLLVPVDEVEEISGEEERVVLNRDPLRAEISPTRS